ncbi:MAG TPA: hypothetical protein VK815_01260 [Candidatus Acidoferrales bacterium]|jgi:hypothetical protein|nr:hypothetical protein [Candidatus Acidoferrales bacterium]
MKTRWKILIGVGIFLLLAMASAWMTAHHRPQSAVEAYKKLLREKGEKLEISEVSPPPVPAESNSVEDVRAAFRMIGSSDAKIPFAMKLVAPGKAMVGWRQPEAVGDDFTNSWEDLAAEMAVNRQTIELLEKVLDRPKLDFQLDYKKNFELLLPHLAPMKRSAQHLAAAAILNLHAGNPGAAATNILVMLGLVQRNRDEGILISHLVRIAIASIALAPTWELLQATNVTDAQLAAVQKSREQLDFMGEATNAIMVERAWGVEIIEKARSSHENFQKIFGFSTTLSGSSGGASSSLWDWPPDWQAITEKPRYAVGEVMWRSSWSYSEEFHALQGQQIVLETLRAMQTNRSQFYKADYDAMQKHLSSLGITNVGAGFFKALNIPDMEEIFGDFYFGNVVSKVLRVETAGRIVDTAIALKRFQLKHGKWPEKLDELAPEFMASVRIDPYDGKPLKYHATADGGYLLYSVGEDGTDDGGDPSLPPAVTSNSMQWQNAKARDWVWPQPATAAEVKSYYDAIAAKAAAEAAAETNGGTLEAPAPVPAPPQPAGTN